MMVKPSRWDTKTDDVLGLRFLAKTHESQSASLDESECDTHQEPAESEYVIPNSSVAGSADHS